MNVMNIFLRQQSNRGLSDNGGIYSLRVELVESRTGTEQEKILLVVQWPVKLSDKQSDQEGTVCRPNLLNMMSTNAIEKCIILAIMFTTSKMMDLDFKYKF